jgi:hypothetical protein
MSYIYKVFEHLEQLWMGIWQHTHTVTTTEVSPDLGLLAEILDDVSVEMIPLRSSCDPNCVLEIKDHEGTPHACVVAKKMICSGLELTIHYNWERKQDDPFTECLCGSRKCDGKIEKLGK